MPFDKSKYPSNWAEISRKIKEREGWKCKFCGLRQYAVFAYNENGKWHCIAGSLYFDDFQYTHKYSLARQIADDNNQAAPPDLGKWRVCVLTVAHLHDPDPMNCDDDNLAALCQRCHLRLDAKLHAENASKTRDARSGQGSLMEAQA